ncbi:hypothetical protein BDV93DRAFT_609641 [Ceratobasidium sp. AG-I]|nr:hypothetical protein BDV93DRAFT_610352 [Ceratobasidium sp. AG-I]KAF8598833.1 hypothetical protein BDV93DRAFT_609641 [Ceratobasidium sp. AG-I]
MAPPSQVPAPKPSAKSYYTPDDETSYSTPRHSVTYSKKTNHPTSLPGAHELSRPGDKESSARALASIASKQAPNKQASSHEARKRPRSPSQSAAHKHARRALSPPHSRRSPSHSRRSPPHSRRSPSRSRRSPTRDYRSPSRSNQSRSRRSPSRGRRLPSRSLSEDSYRSGEEYNIDGGGNTNEGGAGDGLRDEMDEEVEREQEMSEGMGEERLFDSASAGPSNRGANLKPTRHDDSDNEAEVRDKGKRKAVQAYDDNIDEMRSEVDQSWRGEVAILKQQLTGLQQIRDDVQTLRSTLGLFFGLVGSNKTPVELQEFANKALATLEGVSDLMAVVPVPASANQSSNPKRSHKKKVGEDVVMYDGAKERILVDHSRRTIYRQLGITAARQLRPPIQNEDKTYEFWANDENGVSVMHPVWGPQLGVNRDAKNGWVPQYVEACQDETHMSQHKAFLLTVPGSKFISVLERTTWPGLWDKWREIEKGVVGEKEKKGRARGRDYSRANLKVKARDNARSETEVAGPAMEFLVNRDLQSPEISDSEDSNRKCIDEAIWRSKDLIDVLDALSLKDKLSKKKKPSPASRTVVVYYKTNTPIPVLLGGIRIPLWAISPTWIKNNSNAFRDSQGSIDMTATDPPDVKTLLTSFPPRTRNYVNRRPIRAKTETLHTAESPPHSEAPLPLDNPSFVPVDADVPLEIIPGPPEMINEARILDPTIEPSLQGEAGTIVVPHALPPPVNPPPPYPMAQPTAVFAVQQPPGQYYAPPNPQSYPQSAAPAAQQPATNTQPPLPSNIAPQTQLQSTSQFVPNTSTQQADLQSVLPAFQMMRDAATDFLYQQNGLSAPNGYLGPEGYQRWQDLSQIPMQAYHAPSMPPPPLLPQPALHPEVPGHPETQGGSQATEPDEVSTARPIRTCRAPKETKKTNEKDAGGSARGGNAKGIRGKGRGRGK